VPCSASPMHFAQGSGEIAYDGARLADSLSPEGRGLG
jgi:hypothetical protein